MLYNILMSRSYKKNPVVKDYNKGKKRLANKKVKVMLKQNPDAIGQNGNYKKAYEQWEISDWAFRMTEQEWKEMYYEYLNSPIHWKRHLAEETTLEQWMAEWKKTYKRK